MAVSQTGEIYLAGYAHDGPDTAAIAIARLLVDGTLDQAYGTIVHAHPDFHWVRVTDAALQIDGKLVVTGYGQHASGRDGLVCRFAVEGTVDPFFGDADTPGCTSLDAGSNDVLHALAIQADGRIVVVGKSFDVVNRAIAFRLEPDGELDESFGNHGVQLPLPGSPYDSELRDVAQGPDGALTAVGHLVKEPGQADWFVFRLRLEDGSLDPMFGNFGLKQISFDLGPPGNRRDHARAVQVLADGAIVVAGHAQHAVGIYCPAVAKLKPNGLPYVFGVQGKYVDTTCLSGLELTDMSIQFDHRLILTARSVTKDFLVWRLNANGSRDKAFGVDGRVMIGFDLANSGGDDSAARVCSHGSGIIVAGYAQTENDGYDFAVVRLRNDLRQRPRAMPPP